MHVGCAAEEQAVSPRALARGGEFVSRMVVHVAVTSGYSAAGKLLNAKRSRRSMNMTLQVISYVVHMLNMVSTTEHVSVPRLGSFPGLGPPATSSAKYMPSAMWRYFSAHSSAAFALSKSSSASQHLSPCEMLRAPGLHRLPNVDAVPQQMFDAVAVELALTANGAGSIRAHERVVLCHDNGGPRCRSATGSRPARRTSDPHPTGFRSAAAPWP